MAKLKHSPCEFIDMLVKKKWREEEWCDKIVFES